MRKTVYTSLIVMLFILVVSCSKGSTNNNNNNPAIDCSTVTNKNYSDVDVLVQTFCNKSGCHDIASVNGPGPLTNYNQVFNARTSIREAVRTGLMPQNTTLTLAQKSTIVCWVDSGAQNN